VATTCETSTLCNTLAASPDDGTTHMNLGSALYETGAIMFHLRCACELAPGMTASWYNFGKALKYLVPLGYSSFP
jgi:hypothetical protein